MPLDRLYVKEGVEVQWAVNPLNDLIREARNVTGTGGPYDGAKTRYIPWVARAEEVLS